MPVKAVSQFTPIRQRGTGLRHHHEIYRRQRVASVTKRFPYRSFEAVSAHRITRYFYGNSHAQPGIAKIVIFAQYRKQRVGGALIVLEYPGKISLADQPLVFLV